jgi:hypothetical protein
MNQIIGSNLGKKFEEKCQGAGLSAPSKISQKLAVTH